MSNRRESTKASRSISATSETSGPGRTRIFELGNDQNRLLIAADPQDRATLQPFLEPVTLLPGEILLDVGQAIDYVYFPQSGVISLLTMVQPNQFVETCTIGREGAVGLVTGLGSGVSLSRVVVQIAGRALRMRAALLNEILPKTPSLNDIKTRYGEALISQVLQTLACNTLHSVEQRLCRWLLICRDRTASNTVPLTPGGVGRNAGCPAHHGDGRSPQPAGAGLHPISPRRDRMHRCERFAADLMRMLRTHARYLRATSAIYI